MSRTRNSSEAGFTLAGLIVLLTIISITIAYTVPRQWSIAVARERDQQTLYAMKQYARAIRNFQYAKNNPAHAYPTSLDQLKQARNPRVIRGTGEFLDPLTGKVDWIPVPPSAGTPQPGGNPVAPTPPSSTQSGQPGGYVGPIAGVRPNKTGTSYLIVNGVDAYEQWRYTAIDLQNEINQRQYALTIK
jgi:type II secretory pathway pseudopilin PulG